LSLIRVDISVLSPLEPIPVHGEADAVARLARDRPGIVFRSGWRRSVLLPKVWESIEDAPEFLRHLKLKAGLPATYWSDAIELSAFTCEEFAEAP
jgi:AMMECR1 domain-containing protein